MKLVVLKFGLLSLSLALLLLLSNYSIVAMGMKNELLILLAALGLIGFGLIIGKFLLRKKATHTHEIDQQKIKYLGISKREWEVLNEITSGKSNDEIAHKLFISENTVKTHVSSLLTKLNARRRTEAVKRAREMHII